MAANCDVCGKGPRLRQERLALAPPHLAPLETPTSRPSARWSAAPEEAERVHVVHQGGQGHPARRALTTHPGRRQVPTQTVLSPGTYERPVLHTDRPFGCPGSSLGVRGTMRR